MSDSLNNENRQLRQQLNKLVEQARSNEEKMRRFSNHELLLISTTSLAELITLILYQTREAFKLDTITLTLVDPEYEFTRILEATSVRVDEIPELIIEPDITNLHYLYNGKLVPRLGPYLKAEHSIFFPSHTTQPSCIAMLPLVRNNKLIGSLNLGSKEEKRYGRGSGTEFLHRLAIITATCLENTLNQERLKQVGFTDPLTRVNNRRFFDQRLGEEVAAALRNKQPLSCLFFDADHFKRINDELGHQAGDAVLIQLAELMNEQLRRNDVLCRYGGEEFVGLLPSTPMHAATEIAERIRESIAEHHFNLPDKTTTKVTVSIGIAVLDDHPYLDNASASRSLVAAADAAVYKAKENGRNRIEINGHNTPSSNTKLA